MVSLGQSTGALQLVQLETTGVSHPALCLGACSKLCTQISRWCPRACCAHSSLVGEGEECLLCLLLLVASARLDEEETDLAKRRRNDKVGR